MSKEIDFTRLEILKMVKDLVLSEHQDRRAQDHNRWLAESDQAWKTQRVRLPYPTIPPYPSEKDIIARAETVIEFLSKNKDNDDDITLEHLTPQQYIAATSSEESSESNDFELALQYLKSQEYQNKK